LVGSIVPGKGIATIRVAEQFLICFVRSYIIQCCLRSIAVEWNIVPGITY